RGDCPFGWALEVGDVTHLLLISYANSFGVKPASELANLRNMQPRAAAITIGCKPNAGARDRVRSPGCGAGLKADPGQRGPRIGRSFDRPAWRYSGTGDSGTGGPA